MHQIIESKIGQVTMSSLELVEFINANRKEGESELRHDNFMAKVPQVLSEGGVLNFKATYTHPQNGQQYPCYHLPKREACLMAMSYSYELQAKVYDRMTELEQGNLPKLPSSYLDALKALVASEESKVSLTLQLQDAQPAVAYVANYVDARNLKNFREVAKVMQIKERDFITMLENNGIVYRLNGSIVPFAEHLQSKPPRFEVKTGVTNGHAWTQTRFTAAGIVWVAQKLGLTQEAA